MKLQEKLSTNSGLTNALDAMEQGFLWTDENLVIKQYNDAFLRLLEIAGSDSFVGQTYSALLEFLLERGEFVESGDQERFLAERLHTLKKGEKHTIDRVRPIGIVLRISAVPLPTGGYVFTYLDITRETRALEELKRNNKATVVAMANFAEHRDNDTGVHVLRVARLVRQTARELMLRKQYPDIIDGAFVDCIGTASILHDVGKISMPDSILLKAGPLTDEERVTMKLHARDGAQLLKQAYVMVKGSNYLESGAEIALTHHEWFDGSGYPDSLSGTDIPLSGRICAIADVFDALTSRRPYKAPWTIEQALERILKLKGTQFDPVVVDAFFAVIRERETVSIVQWTDTMSVGNMYIDEQHKILIDTINQLASADSQNDRPLLSLIIDELVSYTSFHFDFEEGVLKDAEYPELETHRRIHQGFVRWIADIREEFIYQHRIQFGERILNFLRDWLRDHILGEDQLYRPFINK